ncbi:MAG: hypothetical protein IPJ41_10865 [Phycisphaerales bacterium]|nr:hypothetical protein [Phycisphaerales bacterium]
MARPRPQRVAIVGPGAIGSVCAAILQRWSLHDVSLCGRRAHSDATTVVLDGEPPILLSQPVRSDPREPPDSSDFVLLTVKAHQTASAGPWLASLCQQGTMLAVLQNGVESMERAAKLAPAATALPVVVDCRVHSESPRRIVTSTPLRLIAPQGEPAQRLAELFGGYPCVEQVEDFITAQWAKQCWVAVTGLIAITRQTSEHFRVGPAATLAHDLALECVRVARAEGASLDDAFAADIADRLGRLPPGSGSSVLTDRLAHRPLEWDARNGVIQRLGRRHNLPTPVSDVIVPLLISCSQVDGH